MMDDLAFHLDLDEDTLDMLKRMQGHPRFQCIVYGHQYRSDVIGIDGTICVRCGERPGDERPIQCQPSSAAAL